MNLRQCLMTEERNIMKLINLNYHQRMFQVKIIGLFQYCQKNKQNGMGNIHHGV